MKKTKGYYLGKLMLLSATELLWVILLFATTYKLFSLSFLTIILYTVELIVFIPLFMDTLSLETNRFMHILKQ
ncbi:MAG: hypothetical protein IKM20_05225 [Erysipelotrichales bacterium]|nr:hypothetical protein [Erysipelotrichales bacterium]